MENQNMMKSLVFKHSVTFTDHNFQSRIGDTCVYNSDKENLVVYREDTLAANFPVRKISLESMIEKRWLEPMAIEESEVPEPTEVEVPKTEEVVVPEVEEVSEVSSLDEEPELVDEVLGELEADGELEEETELEPEKVKKNKGGRPKKK